MRWLVRIVIIPVVAVMLALRAIERATGRRRLPVATRADRLVAMAEGMMLGVLPAAVVSLLVILFSEPLGVSARALPWVAVLPTLGGYLGAGVGIHLCDRHAGSADRG